MDLGGHLRSFDSHFGTCSRMRSPRRLSVLPTYWHPQVHAKEYITVCLWRTKSRSLGEATEMRRVSKITRGLAAGKIERHSQGTSNKGGRFVANKRGDFQKYGLRFFSGPKPWEHFLLQSCNGQERITAFQQKLASSKDGGKERPYDPKIYF